MTLSSTASNRREGGLQIVDQIVHVLDADRKPNERIGDAERLAFFFRDRAVRHERRMIDQALHAAQAFREREQMRVLEKTSRARPDRFSRSIVTMPPKPRICALREIVLRMRFQAGITNLFDFRLLLQPARDLHRVLAMPLHPQARASSIRAWRESCRTVPRSRRPSFAETRSDRRAPCFPRRR